MFVRHTIRCRCYLPDKLFHGIFIQSSIEIFVLKVAHCLHEVVPSGHHYCYRAFVLARLIVMSVQVLSERRAFLSRLVRLWCGWVRGARWSAQLMSSLITLIYVCKAGSLLQGGVHFDFLQNYGISSVSPSDAWENHFQQSVLKNCWISSSNWNQWIFDGFGKNETPLKSKSFSSLERRVFKCSLPCYDLAVYLVVVVYYVSFYGSVFSYFFPWEGIHYFFFIYSQPSSWFDRWICQSSQFLCWNLSCSGSWALRPTISLASFKSVLQ